MAAAHASLPSKGRPAFSFPFLLALGGGACVVALEEEAARTWRQAAVGLKARRSSQPTVRSGMNSSSAPGSPGRIRSAREKDQAPGSLGKSRRPMTSAEIMRQQMRVPEQSDARLRKTLMRTLVAQVGKKADTIVLPLELLRHLKVADFADGGEHHQWRRRQLKLLEAGLIHHPSLPLDRLNAPVLRFREIMEAADARAVDTGKASDTMRALCDAVLALASRSAPGTGPRARPATGLTGTKQGVRAGVQRCRGQAGSARGRAAVSARPGRGAHGLPCRRGQGRARAAAPPRPGRELVRGACRVVAAR